MSGQAGRTGKADWMEPTMSEVDLQVRDVTVRFGGLVAVDSVSFDVTRGETFGVIGPNGAGKSTLLNAISGLVRVSGGTVHVVGAPVHGLRPDQRTRLGVGRTFQAAEVFNDFRVIDYVSLGRLRHQRASLIATALRLPSIVAAERDEASRAREILARFDLEEVAGTAEFVTALQLDTKIDGLPAEVLASALQQALDKTFEMLADAVTGRHGLPPDRLTK